MIGLVASYEEHSWVREFFELFKTPWEFCQGNRQYDVLICAATAMPEVQAKLVIIYGSLVHELDREWNFQPGTVHTNVVLKSDEDRIPIYGGCLTFGDGGAGSLRVESDGAIAALAASRAGTCVVRVGYDLFREVRHLLTQGQPRSNASIPALDWHIALLRNWIVRSGTCLVEIPPVPHGHVLVACLTHDVDHPEVRRHRLDHTIFGFLHRALLGSVIGMCRGRITFEQLCRMWVAAVKLPLVHAGLVADFWKQMDRYLELEQDCGSTFFVVPTRDDPGRAVNHRHASRRATRYEAADIAGDLRSIVAADHEVGLHGIDAWLDGESGRAERAKVATAVGRPVNGVRMHWLCFNENSPNALDAAGFGYDSTVGYNECVGYRAGTLQVYRPMGVEQLLELPLHVMDTALFYPGYLDLSPREAMEMIDQFLRDTVRFGGVLTFNWHDRSLAPERLWGGVYAWLIGELRRQHAWCPTAERVVEWFRRRRNTRIERVSLNGDRLCVKISVPAGQSDLPALRLRVHNPPGTSRGTGTGFVDLELASEMDGPVSLQN